MKQERMHDMIIAVMQTFAHVASFDIFGNGFIQICSLVMGAPVVMESVVSLD